MKTEDHITATTAHLSNPNIYKELEMPFGDIETDIFINKLTKALERNINNRELAGKRNFPKKALDLLFSHHTRLSTARVMLKTHKYSCQEIKNLNPQSMKTRPIVSGCNSPAHKVLWFLCRMLSPKMKLVPSHLENTYQFLKCLKDVPKHNLRSLHFFTADVEALFTNINVSAAIEDTMRLAKENRGSLCTFGFKLSDINQLLLETLGNSYFVYNKKVYLQLQSLFQRPCLLQ